MRFGVLGPLVVTVAGREVAVTAPKQRALLAALLVARGRAVSTERLVEEVWPEGAPSTAAAALQVYVSGLRKIVGDRLRTTPPGYTLDAADEDVDAHRFEALKAEPDRLGEALALWRGPAFEGVPAGLVVAAAATRLNEARLAAREEWAARQLADGRHAELVPELAAWVVEHPTAEQLVGHLMLALHRSGRTADALQAYQDLAKTLHDGLSTVPGEAVTELAEAIRRRDPTVDASDPRLPTPANRFIGRRAELDRAAALLGGCRLLTIVGPGGCGKTRLSYELAREAAAGHPDGVHLVELAGAPAGSDVDALAARVGAAIGAREVPGEPVATSLARRLNTGRILLILDNCEHLRAASAALTDRLLTAVPTLRMVATSREPLGLAGEVVLPLGGLTVPGPDVPADAAARSDAVRLLADRVAGARGGARLRAEEVPVAVELCRRLDGLPLALELAAARLRALSLREVTSRLDRRLDLLVGSSPVDRHRTMRAAIDWGHDLLDEPERLLFRRLSVFAGGFDLAAAERVAAAERDIAAAGDVDLVLTHLVERSIVEADTRGSDGTRYRLIETIREYAAERLARDGGPAEVDALRRRHAQVYADLLAPPPPVDGPKHAEWLARMGTEHDNIRTALEWALSGGDADTGLAIAAAMWWYWWITGQMVEGRTWLGRALKATDGTLDPVRAKALRAAAALARNSGDLAEARRLGEESLAAYRLLDDRTGAIAALNSLLITAHGQGDFEASLTYGYEALQMAEEDGNARGIAAAQNNIAGTLRCLDRMDEAEDLFRRALAGFQGFGDRRAEAAARSNLAVVARRRGDLAGARALYRQVLTLYTELAIPEGQLDAVEGFAYLANAEGRPAEALRLLVIAERERSRLGAPIFTPDEITDRDRTEESARAALSRAEVSAAFQAANEATLAATVALLGGHSS